MHGLHSAVYSALCIIAVLVVKNLFHAHVNMKKLTIVYLQKNNLYSLNVSKAIT